MSTWLHPFSDNMEGTSSRRKRSTSTSSSGDQPTDPKREAKRLSGDAEDDTSVGSGGLLMSHEGPSHSSDSSEEADKTRQQGDVSHGERSKPADTKPTEEQIVRPACTITIPKDVYPLNEEKFKRMESEHINKVRFVENEMKYLSHYLLYQDMKKHVHVNDSDPAVRTVKAVMEQMKDLLKNNNEFSGGTIDECGSSHENTKVGDSNEFDYIYKVSIGSYTAIKAEIARTKPSKSHLNAKAYFNLYNGIVNEDTPLEAREHLKILAEDKHEAFKQAVAENLRTIFKLGEDENIFVKKAGPAVKFVLLIPNGLDTKKVNVDLTLAIDADPRDLFGDGSQIRSWAKYLMTHGLLKCHFVSAHDYWKLSFPTTEKCVMKMTSSVSYKGTCYRAIKVKFRQTHGILVRFCMPIYILYPKIYGKS
jgi:hypothetical protein